MRSAAGRAGGAGSGAKRRSRDAAAAPDDRGAAVMMATHLIGFFVGIHHTGMDQVPEVLRGRHPAVLFCDLVVDVTTGRGRVERAAEDEIGNALLGCPTDRFRAQDAGRPDRWVRLLQWQLPWIDDAQVIMLALPAERAGHGPGLLD